jgi:hypothetical protein
MACGCELRGAPARQNSIYLPGVYASLAGLRGLGVAAEGTPPAAPRGLTDAEKAQLREKLQRVAQAQRTGTERMLRTITNVGQIITSLVSMVIGFAGSGLSAKTQSDIRTAMGWIQALLSSGNTPPPTGDADIGVLRAICTFWGSFGGLVSAGLNGARALALTAATSNGTGRMSDTDAALLAVGDYLVSTLNGWCGDEDIRALINPAPSAPPPEPQVRTARGEARVAWNNARAARLLVENSLRLGPSAVFPTYAVAQRTDCSSAAALLAAETALIQLTGSVPAISGTPASTVARSYFVTPPAASCGFAAPAGGGAFTLTTGGGGGGGGGGAGIAIAGAGLLAALMFFRR